MHLVCSIWVNLASPPESPNLYRPERPQRTQDYRDGMNNLVEVISGSKPMTVEEYVTSTRSKLDTDGRYAVKYVLLPIA